MTEEQKENCLQFLQQDTYDKTFMQKIITQDKSWVYGYNIETTKVIKKARQSRFSVKAILNFFFDFKGVMHFTLLPQS